MLQEMAQQDTLNSPIEKEEAEKEGWTKPDEKDIDKKESESSPLKKLRGIFGL